MFAQIINTLSDLLYSYILIVLLLGTGIYFTFKTRFVQFRMLGESIRVVMEPKNDENGLSSFQALMVSTASRVGTGNIAGISTAICLGGAGAVFWMWVTALLGSASAFIESTLAQIYKRKAQDGTCYGGPAYYIQAVLKKRWLGALIAGFLIMTYMVGFNLVASFNIADSFRTYSFFNESTTPMVVGGILAVISKDGKEIENMTEAYTEASGIMINSGEWNGMESSVLKKEGPHIIEKKGIGRATVNYKLRDWVFSRQRYWGEPIPIVHCPDCGAVPVPEEELPLRLPDVESYEPTGTGESPLAGIEEWVNCKCPVCGKPAKRETNTMPQWAGSSWYFLRYVDNHNSEELVSREKADALLPVDMYIGGVEHAVLHLLYSRFYTKFLCDIGVIDFDEPFTKLFNQGMITGKNGIKMSKSKGNVVSPDDLVRDYGCDSLRMYELFVGPPELDAEWDDRGIDGVYRFLKKVWNLLQDSKEKEIEASKDMVKERHKLIYDVTTRLESFSLNTVISAFMEHTNKLTEIAKKAGGVDKETLETLAVLLAPFAPHMAEEMWEELGHEETVFHAGWPSYDKEAMKDDEIEIAVQINGKTRAVVSLPAEVSKEEALEKG